jgi:hypothetical protein
MEGTQALMQAFAGWLEREAENCCDSATRGSYQEKPAVVTKQQHSALAKLIKKVYGVDPLICPKCGSEMNIIAIIMDPEETAKILHHLVKTGKSPPGSCPVTMSEGSHR